MKRIITICLFCTLGWAATAFADSFSTHLDEIPGGYNYILYEPDSISDSMPLIISLHSRGASGSDLSKVDRFGTIDALRSGMKLNAYVLAPQAPGDNWDPERVMATVDQVAASHAIDPNRIYAIGMSMGGNGVADLAAEYHDRIAAAIVLAGSLTRGDVSNLNKLPLWIIRGKKDREDAIFRTDKMVKQMRTQPDKAPRLVYSKVRGLDHRQHERMLYMHCFYEWLMSHNLTDSNRAVNATIDITPALLKDAYKGLKLRAESAPMRQSRPKGSRRMPYGRR